MKIQISSLNNNKLILAAVMIVSFIFAFKVWQGQAAKVNNLKRLVLEEETKISVLKDIESSAKKLDAYRKTLRKEEVGSVVAKINNFASSSNIDIISIQPQKEETRGNLYKVLPITLNIKGRYHDIGKFVSLLEGPGQFFSVSRFNLSSSQGSSEGFGLDRFDKKEAKKELLSCSLVVDSVFIE